MAKESKDEPGSVVEVEKSSEKICGIIMPIADTDGYPLKHWGDVLSIVKESVKDAGFIPNLVSEDIAVGSILKRIVQNIYDNPIVICDISSRNANVMFELGMRLAFDKPTIIIKDDLTPYSFDIQSIETLSYPNDLRYQAIQNFKVNLRDKITGTYERSKSDKEHTTFLRNFGTFKVATVKEQQVEGYEILQDEVRDIKRILLNRVSNNPSEFLAKTKNEYLREASKKASQNYTFDISGVSLSDKHLLIRRILNLDSVIQVDDSEDYLWVTLNPESNLRIDEIAVLMARVQSIIDTISS